MKATKPVVESLDQAALRTIESGGTVTVTVDGHGALELDATRVTITAIASTSLVVQQGEGMSVALDPALTPELRGQLQEQFSDCLCRTCLEAEAAAKLLVQSD
jgi:hypothetical protein